MPTDFDSLLRFARENVTPLLVYQIFVSGLLSYSVIVFLGDWFTYRRPTPPPSPLPTFRGEGELLSPNVTPPADADAISGSPSPRNVGRGLGGGVTPSLSVLIPARNEEAVIGACVRSLLEQDYPGELEVLVLDDRSEDATGKIVADIAAADSRVKLLAGSELLPGWKGKPNALRQLSAAATGELLLLTDADCVFYPGALRGAVELRESMTADVLSLTPYLEADSFWEHVCIPLQYMIILCSLPVWKVYSSRNPAFAAANGAFILVAAQTYRDLGGHESVKNQMAEDTHFAQNVKRSGRRLVYGDGSTTYGVRMYNGLREIWQGFSKNVFSAMGNSLGVVIAWIVFLLTTQVLPFVFVIAALTTGDRSLAGFWTPLAQGIISLLLRGAVNIRFRQAWWGALLQPVGWLVFIGIVCNSAYLALSGKGHAWKGRTYTSNAA